MTAGITINKISDTCIQIKNSNEYEKIMELQLWHYPLHSAPVLLKSFIQEILPLQTVQVNIPISIINHHEFWIDDNSGGANWEECSIEINSWGINMPDKLLQEGKVRFITLLHKIIL